MNFLHWTSIWTKWDSCSFLNWLYCIFMSKCSMQNNVHFCFCFLTLWLWQKKKKIKEKLSGIGFFYFHSLTTYPNIMYFYMKCFISVQCTQTFGRDAFLPGPPGWPGLSPRSAFSGTLAWIPSGKADILHHFYNVHYPPSVLLSSIYNTTAI